MVDPHQLNEYVRPLLEQYLVNNYQLTLPGQAKVIHANSQLSSDYARMHNMPVGDWCYDELHEKLMRLPPGHFGRVMDVCAGTGYVALNIMRKNLFTSCVALDINPSALKMLSEQAKAQGIRGIETHASEIMNTTFTEGSFDCVMGNAFLHHLPDTEAFLKEMHRILKPGGVLCMTYEPTVSASQWENYFPRLIKNFLAREHRPNGEVPLTDIWQFDEAALTQAFHNAGFKEVKISGFGRWSTGLSVLTDRLWVRFTGWHSPAWIGWILYKLIQLESALIPLKMADAAAAFSASARK